MGRTRKKIVALLVSILVFSSSSHAFAYLQPDIDWGAVETFTYEYEYDMFENSLMVKFLQYWLGIEQDSVYGPNTNRAHRQRAMERNITVPIHEYIVPDQNFGPAVEQWRNEVILAITRYGGPATDVPKFLRVMRCESGGDPNAYNEASGASGLMQHLSNYFPWRAKMAGYEGASPFDPVANINTSAWLIYEHRAGGWQHWVCQ
tara:strand:+ start:515 stop:1126 length:612 start_codon:yes stop_codon:yes gene_type:complete